MGNLENFQNSIGDLKVKADDLQVEEENKDNLNLTKKIQELRTADNLTDSP